MKKELEILKLKEMLEKANIPFRIGDDLFGKPAKPSYIITIYNNYYTILCDAVFGFSSYGYDKGLLEINGGLTEEENKDNSVLGWLTADEVFKRFKYCYEHNTSIYVEETK